MAKKSKSKKSKSSNSQSTAAQFTSGDDVVDGSAKNDKFKAGDGNDLVNGLGGNDKLYGGAGDDTLNGGDGKDQLKGDAGDDSLDGGAGDDKLWGGIGNDALNGGDGKDQLKGGDGDDNLDGGAGNDKLWGGDGDDFLAGGEGNDDLKGDAGNDTLEGGAGNDKLKGGAGDDVMSGGDGNDDLKGGSGNDQMSGDAGDDKMSGGAGSDVMLGGDGDDRMYGDGSGSGSGSGHGSGSGDTSSDATFNDYLDGGAGNDVMAGQLGDDTLLGGTGDDRMSGDNGGSGSGSGSGHHHKGSGSGDTSSDMTFNDYLDGGAGNDWMQGQVGDDTVLGGADNDIVFGDEGRNLKAGSGSGSGHHHKGKGSGSGSGGHKGKGSGSGSGSGSVDETPEDRLWREMEQPRLKGGSGSGSGKKKHKGSGSGSGKGSGSGSGDVSNATFNDYLDGGAGNDLVFGQQGDDEARYIVGENTGASDKYAGGRGIDTLTLDMTHDEWFRADIQQDIADYLAFVAANTDPVTGEANSNEFQFQAFDLIAREFENLRVFVDGVETDPTDHTPVAVDDSGDVLEDDAAIAFGTVLANDDVQDLVQSITLVSGPAEGVLDFVEGTGGIQDGNGTLDQIAGRTVGSFTFDPNDDFEDLAVNETRDVSFTYEVTDADGDTTQATVTITVTGQNDAPIISAGDSVLSGGVTEHADLSAGENTTSHNASGQVTFSDVDVSDTHTSSFAANGSGYRGAFSVNAPTTTNATTDGQIGWSFDIADADIDDLAVGQVLTQSYDVTVDDGQGGTDTETVTITITGTNDAPTVAAIVAPNSHEDAAPVTIDLLSTAADVDTTDDLDVDSVVVTSSDGRTLSFTVDNETGAFSLDPSQYNDLAVGESETVTVTYNVNDANGGVTPNVASVVIEGRNDGPTATAIDAGTTHEDAAPIEVDLLLTAADDDLSDDLDVDNVSANSSDGRTLSFTVDTETGAFSLDPNQYNDLAVGESETVTVTYDVVDGNGGVAPNTATFVVEGRNDAPVFNTGPAAPITEDFEGGASGWTNNTTNTAGAANFSEFLGNFAGGDSTEKTFALSGSQSTVTLEFDVYEFSTWDAEHFQVFADGAMIVDDFFRTDGYSPNDGSTKPYAISVTNSLPSLPGTANYQTEVWHYTITLNTSATDLTLKFGSTLNQGASDESWGLDNLVITEDAGGAAAELAGAVTEIADGATGENTDTLTTDGSIAFGDVDLSDTHTVIATANGAGYRGAMTAIVADASTGDGAGSIDWSFSIADADIDDLAAGQVLTQSYDVTVDDGQGGTDTETVTVTITGTNDAPTLSSGSLEADEDGAAVSLNLAALATDIDSDDDGASLTYTVTGAPTEGTASISGTTLSFTPGADFQDLAVGETRDVTIQVTTTDTHGATAVNNMTVTITGTNDAPTVTAIDAGSVGEDDAVVTIDLLASQTDIDSSDVLSVSAISVTDDLGNAVTFADLGNGSISIDPNQYDALNTGQDRVLTVSYNVDDGTVSVANTATLTVVGDSDVLLLDAVDDDFSGVVATDENTVHTIQPGEILANDTHPTGGTPTITSVSATSALGATVAINGDGSISYTPGTSTVLDEMAQGETMIDSFTYTITDGVTSETATVTLKVSGVDDPPILVGSVDAQSGFGDIAYEYVLDADLFEDHDEGGAISYDVTLSDGSALPAWLSFNSTTRTLSFAANAPSVTDVGLYNLMITATEVDGQSSTTDFTLTLLDGALVVGTEGPDSLTGTPQGDLIQGLGGNDYIYGLPNADVLNGGAGNDYIYGEAGDDVLVGEDGHDRLYGDDGDDNLSGGAGNDYLYSGEGNDSLSGGTGNDHLQANNYGNSTMDGGDGDDRLYGGYDSDDLMSGGDGADQFYQVGYYSSDVVNAGAGNDRIQLYVHGSEASTISLGAGEDIIEVYYSNFNNNNTLTVTDFNTAEDSLNIDYFLNNRITDWNGSTNPFADASIDAGGGYMALVQDGTTVVLMIDANGGGNGFVEAIRFENANVNDFGASNFTPPYPPDGSVPAGVNLVGTSAGDVMVGTIGTDTITGNDGNDNIRGGSASDTIDGGAGNDYLYGEAGDDLVLGGDGSDRMYGDDGNDTLIGGAGNDYMYGGEGSDSLSGEDGNDYLYAQNYGASTLDGGSGSDRLYGGYDSDDIMSGGDDADYIYSVGYYSADTVDAGSGNDTVQLYVNGSEKSTVTLGDGADVLEISYSTFYASNTVTVTDFNTAEDTINMDYYLNNRLTGWNGSSNPFAAVASDPNAGFMQLVQDGTTTILRIDSNGGGNGFVDAIRFENTLVSDFTATNFNPPYPPDGSVPAGLNLVGTAYNDYLVGTIGTDTITGNAGNDNLKGGGESDTIDGGEGNDYLYGEAGDDLVSGGLGSDQLYGNDGNDTLLGGEGNDYLYAGEGNDSLSGGAGNDYLNAENYGNSTLDGGDGVDQLYAGYDSDDIIFGGADADRIYTVGRYSVDVVDAGTGDDFVQIQAQGSEKSTVTLGLGADTVEINNSYFNASNTLTITDFSTAEDVVDIDYYLNNRLTGWDGATNPFGGGFMRLVQDGTTSVLEVDTNGGGNGFIEAIRFENTNVADFTDQNFLIDVATSQGYSPTGGGVNGAVFSGTSSGETLTGTFGDDTINGLDGNDSLLGGNGADVISGGVGDDQITGGFGNDDMSGGAGADEFIFNIGEGQDVIQDFTVGVDSLVMTGGQSIASLSEIDTDGVGGVDSMLVTLADDSTITLDSLLGITDPLDLL